MSRWPTDSLRGPPSAFVIPSLRPACGNPPLREATVSDPTPQSRSVATRVESVIREVLALDPGAVSGSSRLREDLGADSVDAVMLVMAIEREFAGRIPEEDAARLSTVAEVVDYVSSRMGEQGLS